MAHVHAFVDPSGNEGMDFDKPHVSTHFVFAAVILNDTNHAKFKQNADEVSAKYFQGSEIKSSNVRTGDLRRRAVILKRLLQAKCHVYALIIHKRRLAELSTNYRWPRTFYKNLTRRLARELFSTYPDISLLADRVKRRGFMLSLERYVKHRIAPTLYEHQEMSFCDSKESRPVQAADFIAGTIALAFEESKATNESRALLDEIPSIEYTHWPYPDRPFTYRQTGDETSLYGKAISDLACLRAANFLRENERDQDPSKIDQVRCVRFLLGQFASGHETEYVTTARLLNYVNMGRRKKLTRDAFRPQVIGKLRNAGVPIASSSARSPGYKLPCCEGDIDDFLDHDSSVILPMLKRINILRKSIRDTTEGKLDILSKYPDLEQIASRYQPEAEITESLKPSGQGTLLFGA